MKILFIRHASTEKNYKGFMHKIGDTACLSVEGRDQANNLIQICLNNNVEKVFSSPERRALETAEIIVKGINKDLEIVPNLIERDWGGWAGQSWSEVEKKLKTMDLEKRYTFVPPSGESWQQMEIRLKSTLSYIIGKGYQAVGVVTHEGALRGFMPILLDLPKQESFKYHFENASVKIFELENSVFTEIK